MLRRLPYCLPQRGILSLKLLQPLVCIRIHADISLQQLPLQLLNRSGLLAHQAVAVGQLHLHLLRQGAGCLSPLPPLGPPLRQLVQLQQTNSTSSAYSVGMHCHYLLPSPSDECPN